jgi:urease accessory protein
MLKHDISALNYWNNWFSATRETEEVRLASWQMGQSLIKLWCELPENLISFKTRQEINQLLPNAKENSEGKGCNFAIAFGVVAASLEISANNSIIGYIYSWLCNLVSAAVRTVPFGQTTGQKIIFSLSPDILRCSQSALSCLDSTLEWCGWGASLACANHETQYSRLFRS